MKSLFAILIALALPCLILAQSNFNESYPLKGATQVTLEFQYGELNIEKYDGPEIVIESNLMVNGESAVKYFDFDTKKNGNRWRLTVEADFDDVEHRMTIVMNDGTKIFKKGGGFNFDNIAKEEGVDKVYNGVDVDADFTIKVPSNVSLEVDNTYGGVTVNDYWDKMKIHSTYGDVDLVLNNSPANPNFKASSTYSDVDLTLPQSANASLRLTTGYGKIYTDMDLETDKKGMGDDCPHGENISATLNNGSGSISLEAQYSNIYLRKSGS